MPDYADTLADLAKAREDAKVILTELRGTIKDAKQTKQEAYDFIRQSAAAMVVTACSKIIEEQTERVQQTLNESLDAWVRKISSLSTKTLDHINERASDYDAIVDNIQFVTNNMREELGTLQKMRQDLNDLQALTKWLHDTAHKLTDRVNDILLVMDEAGLITAKNEDGSDPT